MIISEDILLDGFDLVIDHGDFDFGPSDDQHIEHIVIASKGSYRQWPLMGVGLQRYFNGPDSKSVRVELAREISLKLEEDNFAPSVIDIPDFDNIRIIADKIK